MKTALNPWLLLAMHGPKKVTILKLRLGLWKDVCVGLFAISFYDLQGFVASKNDAAINEF